MINNSMRIIDLIETKLIKKEPTSDYPELLWFRHASPYKLEIIKPLTYKKLKEIRDNYDLKSRIEEEKEYHSILKTDDNKSFVYATICNYHKMDDPNIYPGYTYYFKLTKNQISKCLFGIVADNKNSIPPKLGLSNLDKCINIWNDNNTNYKNHREKGIGIIQPRIEVIIPFPIKPDMYINQIEDR